MLAVLLVSCSEFGRANDLETSVNQLQPKYVVAVSGGVDSVVLLDTIFKHHSQNIVIAHVDHGIRADSGEDAVFVESLAERYGVPFEMTRLALGENASEEAARDARYKFLREVATNYGGSIVTAHHADDVVETIAINLVRGTGWRGLAVFGADDVYRPMTVWFKHEIVEYATKHGLTWREDSTNASDAYLRNRLRKQVKQLPLAVRLELLALWKRQHELKIDIVKEAHAHHSIRRYPYIMMPAQAAVEVLAHVVNVPLTRPQLHRALLAIKTARPGSEYHLTKEYSLMFSADEFELVHRKK